MDNNLEQKLSFNNINYYLIIIILAFLYYGSGRLSLDLLAGHNIVNVGVFASEGFALAFVLYFGKSVWPGIFIGQFILAYTNHIGLLPSLEISLINSLEAIIGVLLFQKFKLNINFKTTRDVVGFILLIAFVLQPFSSLLSHLGLTFHSVITQNLFNSIFSWWFGNVMGQLLITPFTLLFLLNYKQVNLFQYLLYPTVFGIFFYLISIAFPISNVLLLLSISLSILVYIVSKKGMLYGTTITVVLAIISSYSIFKHVGAFHTDSTLDNIINYNLFVLAHILASFIVGLQEAERKNHKKELEEIIAKEVAKNQEQQLLLIQQSRLAQMGEMLSMIAHQWRQPLNALMLSNQLVVSKYSKGKLDEISIEYFRKNSQMLIQKMSHTIDDFKNFFIPHKEKELYCVNEIVKSALNMVKDLYVQENIALSFSEKEYLYTFGHPNELGQAILNITNNAKDALIENSVEDKEIKIALSKKKHTIILEISDNAGGIPEEIIDKIFDPYFSTKSKKNGTGLGLYMTKMIINEQLDAKIDVKNTLFGARFTIQLKEER
jgi:signal transduction histidine kinase